MAGRAVGPDDPAEASVTVHSSWRGIVGGFFGAGVIALGGTIGVAAVGFRPFPVIVCAIGWALVAVMAFDFPVASTFSASGVRRRMVARRQWFAWREGDQLSRTAPKIVWGERRLEHGGLTLVRGRRRYLLVDRPESAAEFDAVVLVLEADGAAGAGLGASYLPRPSESLPPSWLYRRARWRPDSSADR